MSAVRFIVVMGVSGCGKSTVAAFLAGRLDWEFIEGDALHPAANVEKMRQGIPLDDTDREPWLHEIARTIRDWRGADKAGIIACSALRRCYRETIAGGADDVHFVYLRGSSPSIAQRLAARQGHYMPASLLESQFATLEEPGPDEPAITIDTGAPADELVTEVLGILHLAA
ncbi:gluconokinase [Gluconacetobacter takamatsuzukensis]|uniref:Gluconokinase n=1 Tax=Gluconacetobacter takamatsuzukensis TaxID=1286190 RepID=A0A7W4KGL2_9PROT|nr:gluconokinase [Gluconacetobacter takamatsuzukensis]MBB2206578.1 gluconokinase [Gluconacetobacter takamatsuzukensis]